MAVLAYDRYEYRRHPPSIEESLTRAIDRTGDAFEDAAKEIEGNLKDRRYKEPPR